MPRHFLIVVLISLVVLATGGGLAWANRPEAVVARALGHVRAATTADFVANIGLENNPSTQALLGESGSVGIDVAGSWERQDGPDSLATHVTLTTQTSSVQVKIQGELRLISDKLYLLITTTPQAFPALVQLKDQWIVMDRGASEENTPAAAPDSSLFASVDRDGVEKIGDVSTVKYVAAANNEAVVSFMDSLAGILGTSLSEAQVSQIRGSVAEVKSLPIDIWVARGTSDLQQLKTALTVPGGNAVNFTLQFNSLNQPAEIKVPDGARSIEEILKDAAPPASQ